jgi:predicted nucleotidyltransferase
VKDRLRDRLAEVAKQHTALVLLVLHGSRARGDAGAGSDWDFGYLAGPALDPAALQADLVSALGSEDVDLADLARAGGQLRHRVAADGVVIYEGRHGAFETFWLEAVPYWCDMQGVIRAEYEAALTRLSP